MGINLDMIKEDATSVCTHVIRSHTYRTVIEKVEVKSDTYGLVNVVTFRGLHKIWAREIQKTYIDDDTTFTVEYGATTQTFNQVPFGSTVEVSLRLVVEEKDDDFELRVTHPKHLRIIHSTDGEMYRPFIKDLPNIDLHSDKDAYTQYLELGYDYEKMCEIQQERVEKAEYFRQRNYEKALKEEH